MLNSICNLRLSILINSGVILLRIKRIKRAKDERTSLAVEYEGKWYSLKALFEENLNLQVPNIENICEDMVAFLQAGNTLTEMINNLLSNKKVLPFDEINETAYMPFNPVSYRDFILFEQHYIEATRGSIRLFMPEQYKEIEKEEAATNSISPRLLPKKVWYEKPIYYMGNHLSFVTDGFNVSIPSYCTHFDYELEIGFLIIKPLKNAKPDEVIDAIGGFVIMNDFSARNVQAEELNIGFGFVKTKNFCTSISSVLVTADEILPNIKNLTAEIWINDKFIVESNTKSMYHSLAEAISYASFEEQIYPGEFMASGTLPKCCGLENGHLLTHGDKIELRVPVIATLVNKIL